MLKEFREPDETRPAYLLPMDLYYGRQALPIGMEVLDYLGRA